MGRHRRLLVAGMNEWWGKEEEGDSDSGRGMQMGLHQSDPGTPIPTEIVA